MGKGGARHFSKPQVDIGILVRLLQCHSHLLASLGVYETISRSQACHPAGLMHVLELVKCIVEAEPTCEIHQGNLRGAIYTVYQSDPSINNSKFNGQVWVGLKLERLNVILAHFRRLKSPESMRLCASKLTSVEYLKLQEVVNMIEKKNNDQPVLPAKPLEEREEPPLGKREGPPLEEMENKQRKLKPLVSDVSLDSQGFPACFTSPLEAQPTTSPLSKGGCPEKGDSLPSEEASSSHSQAMPSLPKGQVPSSASALCKPSFMRRRLGQKTPEPTASLKEQLCIVMKKPAALVKRAEATSEKHNSTSPVARKPWLKLSKVNAKNPERAYIIGSQEPGEKNRLIVEIPMKRSASYSAHIDAILAKLRENHLTKNEAIQLREELCT